MDTSSVPLKQCSRKDKCISPHSSWMPATSEHFQPRKDVPSGLRNVCRYCRRPELNAYQKTPERRARQRQFSHKPEQKAKQRKYRQENLEAARKRLQDWREVNRERDRANARLRYARNPKPQLENNTRWRQSNREHHRELTREWMREHPEQRRVYKSKRRALELGSQATFSKDDVQLQLRSQKGKCWHCGRPLPENYHVDHLIPLSRGGSNDANNIVISCPHCNLSKNDRLAQEWNGKLF